MIYVILGQTGSGKTALALKLARELSLPIISADAFQCYKMMSIGTDKPTPKDVEGIDYRFYDCYPPDYPTSVCAFQKECRPLLDHYLAEGKDVLVVGGTFLYIKALLFNYVFVEEKEANPSPYDHMSLSELDATLKTQSPETYQTIDTKNSRRVIRALKQLSLGKNRKEILNANNQKPLYSTIFLNLDIDKDIGNQKIDNRVDKMFRDGFVEEVKALLAKYPATCRPFSSIGYAQLIAGLQENKPLSVIQEEIKTATHQYAKKQRTFLRHQFPDCFEGDADTLYSWIRNDILSRQRTKILLAPALMEKVEQTSLLLTGLGGVGGQALLSFVRLGVRNVTLIDSDTVDPSNLNRQALFDSQDIGSGKAATAATKVRNLAPLAHVTALPIRITTEADLPKEKFSLIVDAIDDVNGKVLLYQKAKADGSLFLSSMGFGFHADSTKVKYGILKEAFDPLAKAFRTALRKAGYPEDEIDSIPVVYPSDGRLKGTQQSRLIGSLSTVPPAAGLALVSAWITLLEGSKGEKA